MKVVTVIGARPQFIKASSFSRVAASQSDVEEVVIHTGQHFDRNMSDVFFDHLGMEEPKYNLGIGGFDHATMTGRMVEQIGAVISNELPDWVLVYGDTNSTLAAAVAAGKLKIPIAHVEAGLRSENFGMPEEQNRVLTDRLSTSLFCPTEIGVENLRREGYPFSDSLGGVQHLENTGDIMMDVFVYFDQRGEYSFDKVSKLIKSEPEDFVVTTIHRPENTDCREKMEGILGGLRSVATSREVVFAMHPRTRKSIEKFGLQEYLDNLTVIPPQPYFEMQALLANAHRVVTDSGGVQKEAYFHKTPCVTVRAETEWRETLSVGANTLCDPREQDIHSKALRQMEPNYDSQLYGVGDAAERILNHIL
ncbi:UDP-N-acetylglucosamine 2-epimerase (non-hydrolyzing) [Luminiphilus sp.]|nr:UDP-N-acetylglucosamine 2-epimerase (non-hydrolyzing) [Luminiphilus sp.]